jgi:ABC-type phosphate/phosphonate transport system substrate-binding protein
VLALLTSGVAVAQELKHIRIGATADLFGDTPKETAETSAEPFKKLMERETGYTGDVVTVKTPFDLARELEDKKIQLGVFEGFEFAWVKPEHANLRPLVIAVNQQPQPTALIVVPKNSKAQSFTDLKGQVLDLPKESKGFVRLLVRRLAEKQHQTPGQFFARVDKPGNIEDALDDAVDGMVPAVAVDSVALDAFRQRKPGRYLGLRVLVKSSPFPAVAVVYRTGVFDVATLGRFRRALLHAADNADGRRVLTLWKLTSFETVPQNYATQLAAIRKAYPAPKQSNK